MWPNEDGFCSVAILTFVLIKYNNHASKKVYQLRNAQVEIVQAKKVDFSYETHKWSRTPQEPKNFPSLPFSATSPWLNFT